MCLSYELFNDARSHKDIWCHVWPYSFRCLCITRSGPRKWTVILVTANEHLPYPYPTTARMCYEHTTNIKCQKSWWSRKEFSVFPKFGCTTRQTYEPRKILVEMNWDISENYMNAKRHYNDSHANHTNSKQM